MPETKPDAGQTPTDRNEIVLVGRVSVDPVVRDMPSGDPMASIRVVVKRMEQRPRPRAPLIDAIDCAAWTPAARRSVEKLVAGDVVEVTGALRRRFHKGDRGNVSRYEVEVVRARRLIRAAAAA